MPNTASLKIYSKGTVSFYGRIWNIYLPSATMLREGKVFTPVCDPVHGGGSLSRGSLSGRLECILVTICNEGKVIFS